MAKNKMNFDLSGLDPQEQDTRSAEEILGLTDSTKEAIKDAPQKVTSPKKRNSYDPNRHLIQFSSRTEWEILRAIGKSRHQSTSAAMMSIIDAFKTNNIAAIQSMMDSYQEYLQKEISSASEGK